MRLRKKERQQIEELARAMRALPADRQQAAAGFLEDQDAVSELLRLDPTLCLLELPQIAELLQVGMRTIRRYIALGLLRPVRIGKRDRVSVEELRRFVRAGGSRAPQEQKGAQKRKRPGKA